MPDCSKIGAAVIGTGFIGTVHIKALRRLGMPLVGVSGSSAEQGAATMGLRSFASMEALLADPAVQVVHLVGFADSFRALFAQVYGDAPKGTRARVATCASFADGHYEMQFCDAVLKSAKEGRWVEVGNR